MLPGYPLLYAAGSVHGEQWLASMRRSTAMAIRVLAWTALSANILLVILFFMPVSRMISRLWNIENVVNGDLREELGWEESRKPLRKSATLSHATIALTSASWPEITAKRAPSIFSANATVCRGPSAASIPSGSVATANLRRKPSSLSALARPYLDRFFASCQLAGHTGNRSG